MAWSIEFDPQARRDMDRLDPQVRRRASHFLCERVALLDDPRSIGDALRGPDLGLFWKYRVGDYRVIVHIEDRVLRILVVREAHRSEAYRRPLRAVSPLSCHADD